MEYERRSNCEELVLNIEIGTYDTETNCILTDRISGTSIDFIQEYNKIKDFVLEEL